VFDQSRICIVDAVPTAIFCVEFLLHTVVPNGVLDVVVVHQRFD